MSRADANEDEMSEHPETPADCGCIDRVNALLQRDETLRGVYLRTTINLQTAARKPVVAADRREGKGRKAPPIIPIFCPFCGIKYGD